MRVKEAAVAVGLALQERLAIARDSMNNRRHGTENALLSLTEGDGEALPLLLAHNKNKNNTWPFHHIPEKNIRDFRSGRGVGSSS